MMMMMMIIIITIIILAIESTLHFTYFIWKESRIAEHLERHRQTEGSNEDETGEQEHVWYIVWSEASSCQSTILTELRLFS